MTTTALPSTPAPPADDPVRAAVAQPQTLDNLRRQAQALMSRRPRPRPDADDVASATVERALKVAANFDPARCSVGGWLHGLLANVAREKVREFARHPHQPPAWEPPARPATDLDLAEHRFMIERFLSKLDPVGQAAVKMRYLEEREYPDIAAALGVSPVNARMLVSRAITKMKAFAGKEGRP